MSQARDLPSWITRRAVDNRLLAADAYTVSSFSLVSAAMRERAAYHLVFRDFAPPPGVDGLGPGRLVFHGLTALLGKLLARPLERREIDEARQLLATFHAGGTPYPADWPMWERVVELGHFPLRIYARRDGSIVNIGEPVVQVVSEPGFGELAAHFESKLVQVWAPSARATVTRKWLEYNEDLVRRTTDVTDGAAVRFLAQLQLSDFGDRAGSCAEESEVLGLAHLTSHGGTDTLAAAWLAFQASGGRFGGSSVRALAHRVVQGHDDEGAAFRQLLEIAGDGSITSHVADCYDFERAVDQHLVPLAKAAAARGAVVVARPDSGDGLGSILHILHAAKEVGLWRKNGRGLVEMTSLRYIYADGLDFAAIREINSKLERAGFSVPMCGVYGVGGHLRDCLHRDMVGAAMKLCAVGGELRPVAKLSGSGKTSIPGLVRVTAGEGGGPTVFPARAADLDGDGFGELRLLYDRGRFTDEFLEDCDFSRVRARVLDDWDRFVPSREVLAGEVVDLRRRVEARHR